MKSFEPTESREQTAALDRAWDDRAAREGAFPPVAALSDGQAIEWWKTLVAAGRSRANPRPWVETLYRRVSRISEGADKARVRTELDALL